MSEALFFVAGALGLGVLAVGTALVLWEAR